ncbi:AAA family ATPase [Cnuibacter sp. UC19_7]|uniref:AAA family ATPase n=1 Tax=Cnuibacter sp. UC19_7 TaxID=3350166 RepID=UPI003670174D
MLTTVAVSGYRSLVDLVAPLGPLTVVHGANGTGKSSLYRALRLVAGLADDSAVASLAREGGLDDVLWAGPESPAGPGVPAQGTVRKRPVSLRLGFASDDLGYVVDLGLAGGDPRSLFRRDPEIKLEQIFAGPVARPAALLVDRRHTHVRVRDGSWSDLSRPVGVHRSILSEVADAEAVPEAASLRIRMRGWRFYDNLRTDAAAPARQPQIGTRTLAVAGDGRDVAAAVQTILEQGQATLLAEAIDMAFPGSRLSVRSSDGVFTLELHQPGLLRPLSAAELSDGTLRFVLLATALLSPDPPGLLVLNEPETGLHVDLLPALAQLISRAVWPSQVIVITHSTALAELLVGDVPDALSLTLQKTSGETRLAGFGILDVPLWDWPRR